MAAFNFKAQFELPIRQRVKAHTIRAERKDGRRPKPGEALALYTGMRTKQCRLIGRAQCSRVEEIVITPGREWDRNRKRAGRIEPGYVDVTPDGSAMVIVAGVVLDRAEKERLAVADGFRDFADMMEFWTGRLPFKGVMIHWTEFEEEKSCSKQ